MKTHFNYVFSQIKRLISDIFAFLVLCTLTHRFLKDVTEATQLAAQLQTSLFSYFCLLFAYANCRLCRAVQILITTSCSTYVKLFERGLNESFIASVFCDQELDGQV